MLTIATMTSVQVIPRFLRPSGDTHVFKDIFMIRDGAQGALDELERRKFTAEEGVSEHGQPDELCANDL